MKHSSAGKLPEGWCSKIKGPFIWKHALTTQRTELLTACAWVVPAFSKTSEVRFSGWPLKLATKISIREMLQGANWVSSQPVINKLPNVGAK